MAADNYAVGIGDENLLKEADDLIKGFEDFDINKYVKYFEFSEI